MSKQEEIIEVCGKKVVVRYAKDGAPCEKCVLNGIRGCGTSKCSRLDKVGMEIDERAYFVEAEQPEEAPARPANPFIPDQGLTIDGKRYEKRYFRIGDACSRCAFKVGEDAKGHARCKDHGKPEKPCTPDREKGVLVYFIAADQLQEEIHSLQEWAKIMAERPDLRAEFDKMCPPQPIQGSIAPEVDVDKLADDEKIKNCLRKIVGAARHSQMDLISDEEADAILVWIDRRATHPAEADLEAEISRFEDELHGFEGSSRADCINIARHFAEWGAEHLKK